MFGDFSLKDTLQTFFIFSTFSVLPETKEAGTKKKLIMNKFPLIHVEKIFYLQHISLALYIQLMRFQINVE